MQTGPEFREEHALRDGTRVVLRHIRPGDAAELHRGFHALSPESRYRRFFGAITELDEAMLGYLTQVDGRNHVAIIALVESLDLKTERGVGVVRFVRIPDEPGAAELAVTVVDDVQNKGLGTLLTHVAMRAARDRGITHFRGDVLADNGPMVSALRDVGAEPTSSAEGVLTFDMPIDQEGVDVLLMLRRLLAVASQQVGVLLRRFTAARHPPNRTNH